jgi:hypothetical protein
MRNLNLSNAYFNYLTGEYNAKIYIYRQIEFHIRELH